MKTFITSIIIILSVAVVAILAFQVWKIESLVPNEKTGIFCDEGDKTKRSGIWYVCDGKKWRETKEVSEYEKETWEECEFCKG